MPPTSLDSGLNLRILKEISRARYGMLGISSSTRGVGRVAIALTEVSLNEKLLLVCQLTGHVATLPSIQLRFGRLGWVGFHSSIACSESLHMQVNVRIWTVNTISQ